MPLQVPPSLRKASVSVADALGRVDAADEIAMAGVGSALLPPPARKTSVNFSSQQQQQQQQQQSSSAPSAPSPVSIPGAASTSNSGSIPQPGPSKFTRGPAGGLVGGPDGTAPVSPEGLAPLVEQVCARFASLQVTERKQADEQQLLAINATLRKWADQVIFEVGDICVCHKVGDIRPHENEKIGLCFFSSNLFTLIADLARFRNCSFCCSFL